ncbi:hypothetical protein [Streptomyces olivoreticuli]|uniref:hypothetical protein n=1 Tax=Streptomyces olivoreticuli TaxID=68246 RepID=UPI0013C2B066|nr:hypothetical protein [Streptomyces olivoreticuli]
MGVVIKDGRTRIWVERHEVRVRRGRVTTVMPGAQVRSASVSGSELTLHLVEQPLELTIHHRNPAALAALRAEIDGARRADRTGSPVRQETAEPWPVSYARAGWAWLDRVTRGNAIVPAAVAYVLVSVPLTLLLADSPKELLAWPLGTLGVALLYWWAAVANLRTRWLVRRRGVTVRPGPPQVRTDAEGSKQYTYRFRALDGMDYRHVSGHASHNGEIRYDPADPSRVVVPTRVMWLAGDVLLFWMAGAPGLALTGNYGLWLVGADPFVIA